MVRTGVECRANSWAVLTDAPPATMPDMYVCRWVWQGPANRETGFRGSA